MAVLRIDPADTRPRDFAGRYAFYDDGWPGTLELTADDDGQLAGRLSSHRFNSDHAVRGRVDHTEPWRAELIVEGYNWLAEQRFDGRMFTHGHGGMAGVTEWQGEPFGFVAARSSDLGLGAFRPGRVRPGDLAGAFRVSLDGRIGTAVLGPDGSGSLTCEGSTVPVRVVVGDPVAHAVRLEAGDVRVFGYLFTRPKSAVAGWLQQGDRRLGCWLVRVR